MEGSREWWRPQQMSRIGFIERRQHHLSLLLTAAMLLLDWCDQIQCVKKSRIWGLGGEFVGFPQPWVSAK